MPKIFFDHQKFSTQRYGGISRYFANLMDDLEGGGFEVLLGVLHTQNEYLKNKRASRNYTWLNKILSSKYNQKTYKLNQQYCRSLLKGSNFDIFHPTYYDPYFIRDLKKPLVITVHDMTHERLPEYFWAEDPLTYNKRLNIERADKIIAISETTKQDLIQFSKVDPARIEVVYHGIDLESSFEVTPVPGLPDNYLLYVGDRSGFKNFYLFARAFRLILERYPDIRMVLSGGGDLAMGEREFLHNLGILEKVDHFHVSDSELTYLYRHAVAFIYPSLHEGFGLPILEAFRAGCPIVLSDTPCFREIAGDAALYFESHSVESLFTVLEVVFGNSALRTKAISAGAARIQAFPISKTTAETVKVYQSVL
ncbi:MAG TPA: glycosyltransferase family 1 protein [Sphingobacteriaceae bacterium]